MLLKHRDGRQALIREIDRILTLPLTLEQRVQIERDRESLETLEQQEARIAKALDFHYKDAMNWAIIHDLRLERYDDVAEMDHVVINRFLDVYVLDTKYYHYGMKVTEEGEFFLWEGKDYRPVDSPLTLNQMNIDVLRQSVGERDLGPRRLDFPVPVKYRNVLIFDPASNLVKPQAAAIDLTAVLKSDEFVPKAEMSTANKAAVDASKMVSYDVLREFGEKLVRLHRRRPEPDLLARYGLNPEEHGSQ
ncbi:nuclease-related domain-containing protein [Geomesophilobacter sediminis]|uniref:NERD domain-containing protein n=1 Tax=Geomesophilobacter sediminis TaxID=2798584 RepID=A0A8J7LYL0_9BACT|nr:nuclease-related domain-containing protein [Geomesophilobacter sediminis]MBJ6725002.1 NERD domain-containing protein [Geomesophilobacter sediminis]